jgi:hypothetical protein
MKREFRENRKLTRNCNSYKKPLAAKSREGMRSQETCHYPIISIMPSRIEAKEKIQ